jgi:hypothetical protein
MPYRVYQGKEILTTSAPVLPRGQITVDLTSLILHIGDGLTPGGVPVSGTTGGGTTNVDGGGAASVFTPNETFDGGGA